MKRRYVSTRGNVNPWEETDDHPTDFVPIGASHAERPRNPTGGFSGNPGSAGLATRPRLAYGAGQGGVVQAKRDIDVVPERCDGCGRKAAACGMDAVGWTVRTLPAGFAGAYCVDCASALHLLPWLIQCSECGRHKANEAAAERAGYRYYPDVNGVLQPYCAECAELTFGGPAVEPRQAPPLASE